MRQLLVHSSGYPRPAAFRSDRDELNCVPAVSADNPGCKWSPSSLDFAALGEHSGGSTGVSTVAGLRILLENQPPASISELRVIGHGNERVFSFAGTILPNDVEFVEAACLTNRETFNSEFKAFQRLADRFAKAGTITVMGCNTGRSDGFLLELLNKAFLVPVKGFVELIDYSQTFNPRGKFRYNPFGQLFNSNDWETNAWRARPDATSRIVSSAPMKAMSARQVGRNKVVDAANVLWDMVNQFFADEKELIHGTGYYPATELSLATVIDGGKKTIDVSQGFIDNLSANTLHWRLRELRVALDLLQNGIARPIALQK